MKKFISTLITSLIFSVIVLGQTNVSAPPLSIFYDGFDTGEKTPWLFYQGTHLFTSGILKLNVASTNSGQYAYVKTNWSNILVQADVKLYSNSWGAAIGLRYNPTNGANYSAWLYQSNSVYKSGRFSIKKYNNWYNTWSEVATMIIPDPGTNVHTIKLSATNNIISANLDNTQLLAYTDTTTSPLMSGGINLSIWGGSSGAMTAQFDNVTVYNLNFVNTPVKIKSMTTRVVTTQGSNLAVSVAVDGTSPSYQWYFGGSTNGIKSATNSSYIIPNVQTKNGGLYTVIVTNSISTVTSLANASIFTTNISVGCINKPSFVTFYWSYDFTNNSTVDGFRFYDGVISRTYTNTLLINGKILTNLVTNIVNGITHYYSITARDSTAGLESDFSNELVLTPPIFGINTNIVLNVYWLSSVGYPAIQTKVCPFQSIAYLYKTNLSSPTWMVLTNIVADQYGNAIYDDSGVKGGSSRFYRASTL